MPTDGRGLLGGVVVGLVALVAALGLLVATRDGPNIPPDGAAYLGAAEHLADGRGITVPFQPALDRTLPAPAAEAVAGAGLPYSVQAPGVSLAMAPLVAVGLGAGTASRVVNALSVAGVLLLAGLLARGVARAAGVGPAGVALSMGLVTLAVASRYLLVDWSVRAVSEPLFLLLSTGALAAVVAWRRGGRARWLACAVALAGASAIVRYVGVATIGAVCLVVLLTPEGADDGDGSAGPRAGRGSPARRLLLALECGLVALAPLAALLTLHDRPARGLSWHPPRAASWRLGGETLGGLLVPHVWPAWARWVALVVLAVLVAAGAVVGLSRPRLRPLTVTLLLFVVTSVGLLVVSSTLVDGAVPVGDRHLLPTVVPLLLLASLSVLALDGRRAAVVAGVLAVLLAVGGWHAWRTVLPGPVTPVLANDFGPVTGPPAPAATALVIRDRPADAVIVSNEPSRVWSTSGRSAIQLPQHTWPDSLTAVADRDERFRQLDTLLRRPGSVIVVYRLAQLLGPQYPSQAELEARLGVRPVAELDDAVLLAR